MHSVCAAPLRYLPKEQAAHTEMDVTHLLPSAQSVVCVHDDCATTTVGGMIAPRKRASAATTAAAPGRNRGGGRIRRSRAVVCETPYGTHSRGGMGG